MNKFIYCSENNGKIEKLGKNRNQEKSKTQFNYTSESLRNAFQ